jgi:hypothetical protein
MSGDLIYSIDAREVVENRERYKSCGEKSGKENLTPGRHSEEVSPPYPGIQGCVRRKCSKAMCIIADYPDLG